MARNRVRGAAALMAAALLLQACVTPSTVHYFDEECKVEARRMELDAQSVMAVQGCVNQQCLAQVVAAAMVAVTSTVISGSIVVVGNVVYWMEKENNCRKARAATAPAGAASTPRP